MKVKSITAGRLEVAYLEDGPAGGWPCIMGHGFPYDVHAYSEAAPILAEAGARVIVPYVRGYGPTRFLSSETPRSGEQAAFGADLLALMDALEIERAVVGGYDWGGRAACIVAALWPERVVALVSGNSYNIFDTARSWEPAPAAEEAALWYQYYFHSERGRRGLTKDRRGIARQLWRMWSPTWGFDDATFERTACAPAKTGNRPRRICGLRTAAHRNNRGTSPGLFSGSFPGAQGRANQRREISGGLSPQNDRHRRDMAKVRGSGYRARLRSCYSQRSSAPAGGAGDAVPVNPLVEIADPLPPAMTLPPRRVRIPKVRYRQPVSSRRTFG